MLPDISHDVAELAPVAIALRRALHRHPELAFEEVRTSATLAARMRDLGLSVREGVGRTGVLAVLDGATPGQTLLVRADMDAVAMAETSDRSMSVHVLPMAHVGQAVIQTGPLWASWDTRTLAIRVPPPSSVVKHADLAHIAARVVTALYELVDREAQTADEVSFRVRSIQAEQRAEGSPSQMPIEVHMGRGQPSEATVEMNLAMYDNGLRSSLLRRIEETARLIVAAAGGALTLTTGYAVPAVVNDERVPGAVARAAHSVIGAHNILTGWRNRFADDFALRLEAAPGCLLLLGTANPERGITDIWHRPGFDVDEDALGLGIEIMSLAAIDLLR